MSHYLVLSPNVETQLGEYDPKKWKTYFQKVITNFNQTPNRSLDYHTPSEIAIGQGRGVEIFSPVRIVAKNPIEQAILAKAYRTILYRKIRYLADQNHRKNKKRYDDKRTMGIEREKQLMAGSYFLI